ncbi:MAG: hypothetical protein Q4E13_14155 [Clostridia bacterium]|nr:hypothetical protein [Clostridia bacterium]
MNYSNTIISGMLSWLRGISNWAINLFTLSGEGSLSMVTWFSRHWIALLIALILLGLAIDWLVWIIRWRPYWVWFRRKRVVIDDSDMPGRPRRFSRHPEDDWDGEEDEDRRRRSARRRPRSRDAEPDFFSVDPSTAFSEDELTSPDVTVDEDSFRPRAHADVSEDPFTISTDDPDAINFWQEDVFNVSDLKGGAHHGRLKGARR